MKKKLTKNQVKNASTYILVTVAFVILQILNTQGKLNSTTKGFLVPACAYIVLAVSLNLLVGICGELSLGHAGFMGIGAFTGIITTALLAEAVPSGPLRLVLGMIVGGVLAGGGEEQQQRQGVGPGGGAGEPCKVREKLRQRFLRQGSLPVQLLQQLAEWGIVAVERGKVCAAHFDEPLFQQLRVQL